MIENDTVKLLRECDAGIKMGIWSIDDVLDLVSEEDFKEKQETVEHTRAQNRFGILKHVMYD